MSNKEKKDEIKVENSIKKKKSSKKKIIGIIAIVVIVLAGIRIITLKDSSTPPQISDKSINVKTTKVIRTDLEVTTPLSGRIQPVKEASIVPLISGEVTKVHVSLGTKVSKGSPLFELDKEQMQNAYNQALAGYNQANAAYSNAKSDFERVELLYNEGAVSKQQYEQSQLHYNNSLQALTQAQSSLDNAEDALDNCIVTSPIDGHVTLINVNEGEIASQAMAAAAVANLDTVEIETSISENLINRVQIGDPVKVLVKSASDEEFNGTISELSPAPAQGSLTYPLKVSINNDEAIIKSGMFAEIKIVSEKKENVLAIPSDSVMIKGGETVVAVLEGDHNTFKKVLTGIDSGEYVEIIQGLNEGDTVITDGQYYLDEGSKVTVIN